MLYVGADGECRDKTEESGTESTFYSGTKA